ncbi:MAG: hypothetical protein SFZ24_11590 [Planctomycetota bacterium]|nr:hypothetical protein [Planctomycetota bacterium]
MRRHTSKISHPLRGRRALALAGAVLLCLTTLLAVSGPADPPQAPPPAAPQTPADTLGTRPANLAGPGAGGVLVPKRIRMIIGFVQTLTV